MDLKEEDVLIIEDWDAGPSATRSSFPADTDTEEAEGFDVSTSAEWIYPTNYTVREYQKNIVSNALFKNTLVSLPTGLGKTFIAAVVMYNFHRWYPKHKVVFMAHSKPLVAQQTQACCDIMGISQNVASELNGTISAKDRKEHWENKRIFFLTPQIFNNDLSRGLVSPESIRCLVIDEAHKAMGAQAYCQAIKSLQPFNRNFRVLALSATPGDDLVAVKAVIENLLISHLELRTEDDADIKKYLFGRKVEAVVVNLDSKIIQFKDQLLSVTEKYLRPLVQAKAISCSFGSLSSFSLVLKQKQFLANPTCGPEQRGFLISNFCVAISLFKASEELIVHGLRSLHSKLAGLKSGESATPNVCNRLSKDEDFQALITALEDYIGKDRDIAFNPDVSMARLQDELDAQAVGTPPPVVYSHPKFVILEQIVTDHFQLWSEKNEATKVMVFCKSRPCTGEICNFLNRFRPLVKPMVLIGQSDSSGGSTSRGLKQKAQLEVMRKFRAGVYNTLVATCVGEEGLDIGEVDLIINFDSGKNSNTQVQRSGRTGRKREGRVVNLVTEGKEYQDYNFSVAKAKGMTSKLASGLAKLPLYKNSPRLLPKNLEPTCQEMFLKPPSETPGKSKKKAEATAKRPPAKKRKKAPPEDLPSSQASKKYNIIYALSQAEKKKKIHATESADDSSGSLFEAAGALQIFKDAQQKNSKNNKENNSKDNIVIVDLENSLDGVPENLNFGGMKIGDNGSDSASTAHLSSFKLPLDAKICDYLDTLSIDELIALADKSLMAVRVADYYKSAKRAPVIGSAWTISSLELSPESSEMETERNDISKTRRRSIVPLSREQYHESMNRSKPMGTSLVTGLDDLWDTSLKANEISVIASKDGTSQREDLQKETLSEEPCVPLERLPHPVPERDNCSDELNETSVNFTPGNCAESTRMYETVVDLEKSEAPKVVQDNIKTDCIVKDIICDMSVCPIADLNNRRAGSENIPDNEMEIAEVGQLFFDQSPMTIDNIGNSLNASPSVDVLAKPSFKKSSTRNDDISMITITQALGMVANFKANNANLQSSSGASSDAKINRNDCRASETLELVNSNNCSSQRNGSSSPVFKIRVPSCTKNSSTLLGHRNELNVVLKPTDQSASSSSEDVGNRLLGQNIVQNATSCLVNDSAKLEAAKSVSRNEKSSSVLNLSDSKPQSSGSSSPVFQLRAPSITKKIQSSTLKGATKNVLKPEPSVQLPLPNPSHPLNQRLNHVDTAVLNDLPKSQWIKQIKDSSPISKLTQNVGRQESSNTSPVFSLTQKNWAARKLKEISAASNQEINVKTVEPEKKKASARKSLTFVDKPNVSVDTKETAVEKDFVSDSDEDLFLEAEKELKIMQTQQILKDMENESSDATQIYTPLNIAFPEDFSLPNSRQSQNSPRAITPVKHVEEPSRDSGKAEIADCVGDKILEKENEVISIPDFDPWKYSSPLPLNKDTDAKQLKNSIATCDDSMPFLDNTESYKDKNRLIREKSPVKKNVEVANSDFGPWKCSPYFPPHSSIGNDVRKSDNFKDSIATCDDSMPFRDNIVSYQEKNRFISDKYVKTPPKVAIVRPMTSQIVLTEDSGWLSTAHKPKSPSLLSLMKPKPRSALSSQNNVMTKFFPPSGRKSEDNPQKPNTSLDRSRGQDASTSKQDAFLTFDCIPDDLADFLTCTNFEDNKHSTPIRSVSTSRKTVVNTSNQSMFGSRSKQLQEDKENTSARSAVVEILTDGELSDDALEAIRAVEEFERNQQKTVETSNKSATSAKTSVVFDVWGSDDEDFFEKKTTSGHVPPPPLRKESPPPPRKKSKKGLPRKKSNPFIVSEAELSDDGRGSPSADEDSSGLDEMDSSFLDERIAPTQAPDVDMTARYLSTVRSPLNAVGGFKIPKPVSPGFPVCSQIELNDDDYERDSFCVDDFVEENHEMSALELAELILDKRKKRRRTETPESKIVKGKKKRRRIVIADSSSDEETENKKTDIRETESLVTKVQEELEPPFRVTSGASNTGRTGSLLAARSLDIIKPGGSIERPLKKPNIPNATPPLVFIGSRQIASTPDITTNLRAKFKFRIEVRSSPGADYIVSWRLGINRITLSDFSNGSPIIRANLKESTIRLLALFDKPVLIIEDDKNKAAPRTVGCHRDMWAKHSAKRLARLHHAGVNTVFTKDKEETAKVIGALTQLECSKGYGNVTDWKTISPALETKLRFYCLLPGVNIGNALRLCRKFSTLSSFMTTCDSTAAIKRELDVSHTTAVSIFHALQSALPS